MRGPSSRHSLGRPREDGFPEPGPGAAAHDQPTRRGGGVGRARPARAGPPAEAQAGPGHRRPPPL